ncbi:MAG: hypothetical protein JO031_09175 [Ktedonobacteraceae bacterium]|nr:hypothetical protein [Ktedonobacteraceae bacterium]
MARPTRLVTECSVVSFLPLSSTCLSCGKTAHIAYHTQRTITTLTGRHRLHLAVRRCTSPECPRYHRPYRPEAEGAWALPHGDDIQAGYDWVHRAAHVLTNADHHSSKEV